MKRQLRENYIYAHTRIQKTEIGIVKNVLSRLIFFNIGSTNIICVAFLLLSSLFFLSFSYFPIFYFVFKHFLFPNTRISTSNVKNSVIIIVYKLTLLFIIVTATKNSYIRNI